jgi:hypothetical protein
MSKWLVLLLLPAVAWCAAQRDFLTAAEVEEVRQAQEPNARLLLYLRFAKERITMVQQLAAKEKAGRGALIHEALDQYTQIIDAIDTVTDDALKRRVAVDQGMKATADAEQQMLEALTKLSGSQPRDLAAYKFVLDQSITATRDSIELAREDLQGRSADVIAREEKEKKEREALMRPEEVEAKKTAEKKEDAEKKKVPTLRRPGEVTKEKP